MSDREQRFKGKYRIPSTRLKGWDYGANGAYFITICTKDREAFFGDVVDGEMRLSHIGEFAHRRWLEIPSHFKHVNLDAFVVMPNHVHGILFINVETPHVETPHVETPHVETPHVETPHVASLPRKFGPLQPGSVSKIIQAYKASVTKRAKENGFSDFAWQSRFYDHIVRDEKSLAGIRAYILGNPVKWMSDLYYSGT